MLNTSLSYSPSPNYPYCLLPNAYCLRPHQNKKDRSFWNGLFLFFGKWGQYSSSWKKKSSLVG